MLKAITSIFFLLFLNGCAQNVVFLGPAITGASTGSMYHAGLSYGSSTAITKITGKSSLENIITFLVNLRRSTNLIITITTDGYSVK